MRRAANRQSPSASTSSTARRHAYRGTPNMGRRDNRVAIITGAGQGIGLSYAKRFLEEGAKVVVAEINEDRAASAMEQLEKLGDAAFVKIDILVNNAALYYDIDNERNDYEYLQKVFSVNLHGAWLMAKACAPTMVEQSWGRIINQSSG